MVKSLINKIEYTYLCTLQLLICIFNKKTKITVRNVVFESVCDCPNAIFRFSRAKSEVHAGADARRGAHRAGDAFRLHRGAAGLSRSGMSSPHRPHGNSRRPRAGPQRRLSMRRHTGRQQTNGKKSISSGKSYV